jgi:chromosome segregation ATPase
VSDADELEQLQRERDDAKERLDDAVDELNAAKSEIDDLQSQIDDARDQIRKLEDYKRDDERELDEARRDRRLRDRVPGIIDMIRARVTELKQLNDDVRDLIRDIKAAQRRREGLKRDRDAALREFRSAEAAVRAWRGSGRHEQDRTPDHVTKVKSGYSVDTGVPASDFLIIDRDGSGKQHIVIDHDGNQIMDERHD